MHRGGNQATPATRKALVMTTSTLTGYIARETDAAVAFVATLEDGVKPFFIPRKKIVAMVEGEAQDMPVQLAGESVKRKAIPFTLEVDTAFLARLGLV